ncbi:hypothetical protein EOD39_16508 [Acipenser ruthenus]|uniref:Uncharacterized protein n=1 Tax=Acipenser ruthenus TaxID=7906 RepID=A0A444U9K7_ACIRT|nr:hypothetical protein EOD39_16508 [Acipenser ruthenus]
MLLRSRAQLQPHVSVLQQPSGSAIMNQHQEMLLRSRARLQPHVSVRQQPSGSAIMNQFREFYADDLSLHWLAYAAN